MTIGPVGDGCVQPHFGVDGTYEPSSGIRCPHAIEPMQSPTDDRGIARMAQFGLSYETNELKPTNTYMGKLIATEMGEKWT